MSNIYASSWNWGDEEQQPKKKQAVNAVAPLAAAQEGHPGAIVLGPSETDRAIKQVKQKAVTKGIDEAFDYAKAKNAPAKAPLGAGDIDAGSKPVVSAEQIAAADNPTAEVDQSLQMVDGGAAADADVMTGAFDTTTVANSAPLGEAAGAVADDAMVGGAQQVAGDVATDAAAGAATDAAAGAATDAAAGAAGDVVGGAAGSAAPVAGAAITAATTGKYDKAAGQAIGAVVGSYFGPIGTVVGGQVGGYVGDGVGDIFGYSDGSTDVEAKNKLTRISQRGIGGGTEHLMRGILGDGIVDTYTDPVTKWAHGVEKSMLSKTPGFADGTVSVGGKGASAPGSAPEGSTSYAEPAQMKMPTGLATPQVQPQNDMMQPAVMPQNNFGGWQTPVSHQSAMSGKGATAQPAVQSPVAPTPMAAPAPLAQSAVQGGRRFMAM